MGQPAAYADILRQHEKFVAICEAAGVKAEAEGGRFGGYVERIRDLNSQLQRVRQAESEGLLFAQLAPDLPRYLVALTETREVGTMVPFLLTCPAEVLTPRLKAMLAGPEFPSEEDQASNQARNIQFELSLATLLSATGISVTLGEPDLRCTVGGLSIFVACKRLFSVQNLNKRINEATVQLRRELTQLPNAFGVIAISLSRVLAVTDRSEAIASRGDGLRKLASRIDTLIVGRRARWQQTREAQAILFQVTSVFTNAETERIESGGFTTMYGAGPVCEVLAEKIQSMAS